MRISHFERRVLLLVPMAVRLVFLGAITAVAAAMMFFARELVAQDISRAFTVVYTAGNDTIAFERVVVDNGRWTGEFNAAVVRGRVQLERMAEENNPWLKSFLAHDPLVTARKVRAPALVLHGETDRQVTADQAEPLGEALRASGGADVTVRVFPGLNHLFIADPSGDPAGYIRLPGGGMSTEVVGLIAEWISGRTGKRS